MKIEFEVTGFGILRKLNDQLYKDGEFTLRILSCLMTECSRRGYLLSYKQEIGVLN